MKQIEVGDTVYFKNDFGDVFKAEVLQLFTDHNCWKESYLVALVVTTGDKDVIHTVVQTQYLTHDSTEYNKSYKRNQIKKQINQLQKELNQL